MKDVFLKFTEFWKAVGNLTLAQIFNCECWYCSAKKAQKEDKDDV